jgi:NAD(P)-dependent dehydrogenase (short-subunit alcohol dehydrogenase family)
MLKGALMAFTDKLATEVSTDNIRVNCVCAGRADTCFDRSTIRFMHGRAKLQEAARPCVPFGRQGNLAEIALSILFLASDASSHMTGRAFALDGE